MNCNTTHYRANSSSVPGDPTDPDSNGPKEQVSYSEAGGLPAERERSIEEELRAHYPWVVRWCLFELRDRASAFDCAQDVMVEVARALSGFERRSQLKTWMYVIVRRTISRFRRKERRHGSMIAESPRGIEQEEADAVEAPGPAGRSPEQQLIQSSELGAVIAAVNRLPEMQRNAVYLYYFEDLSVEECGAKLGISGGTVKTHLSRARETLRVSLGESTFKDGGNK